MFGLSLTVLRKLISLKDERLLGIIVIDTQMNREIDTKICIKESTRYLI